MTSESVAEHLTLALHPQESQREFTVVIHNRSRSRTDLRLDVSGRKNALQFRFDRARVILQTGEQAELSLVVQANPQVGKGARHAFEVEALMDGTVVGTAPATFVVPGRGLGYWLSLVPLIGLALAGFVTAGVALLCPTFLRDICPVSVPDNPISAIIATPTASPTYLLAPTVSMTPTVDASIPGAQPSAKAAATHVSPTETGTATLTPTPILDGNVLIYKTTSAQGVSLVAIPALGDPIMLVAKVDDVAVLDYTRSDGGKLVLKVVDSGVETLWIMGADGIPIRVRIDQGWIRLNDARWSLDGSWLVVEADIPGLTTYYIYDGIDGALRAQPPLFPRTVTPTFTPTFTDTPTVNPIPTGTSPP